MAITILGKKREKLQVRGVELPLSTSKVLGTGIDAKTLPEGHLVCVMCRGHLFEAWVMGDNHRLEMGCIKCNHTYRILFPLDVTFPKNGRWTCPQHKTAGTVLIHNVDVVNIGCEKCFRDVSFKLKKADGLIIAEDMN